MKRSSGFTLVEVMGVIILIAAISLLAFPPILDHVRKSQNEISKATLDLIYSGTSLYVDSEKLHYLKHNGNTYCIPLRSIVDKGFLNDPIQDAATKENMDLDRNVVKAVYQDKGFRYSLVSVSNCVEKQTMTTFSNKMSQSNEVLSNDPGGNLRYVGANPNNYVRFNNELWRIIGLFNGQVKLIRNEPYSNSIAWDTNHTNDWSQSSLQKELNTTFLNGIDHTSKNYIDTNYVWNLGGVPSDTQQYTRMNMYHFERGTEVYSGRPTIWNGAIGLMYPSDYGYSVSSTNDICNTGTMYEWGTGTALECSRSSWLKPGGTNIRWTLTSILDSDTLVSFVGYNGSSNNGAVLDTYSVFPVLYLKSNIGIIDGIGSSNDPFILGFIS